MDPPPPGSAPTPSIPADCPQFDSGGGSDAVCNSGAIPADGDQELKGLCDFRYSIFFLITCLVLDIFRNQSKLICTNDELAKSDNANVKIIAAIMVTALLHVYAQHMAHRLSQTLIPPSVAQVLRMLATQPSPTYALLLALEIIALLELALLQRQELVVQIWGE